MFVDADISQAENADQLAESLAEIRAMVARRAGEDALDVGRLASGCYDRLLVRAAELALAGLGPPPTAFALAVLGSQGRREQYLATDQDNALILGDAANDDAFFAAFARRLAEILEAAGIAACPKGIMAQNPAWRKTVSAWRRDIDAALARGDAKAVVDVSLWADLRPVMGESGLVAAVAGYLRARLAETPLLARYLAREALNFSSPPMLFGHLAAEFFGFGRESLDIKWSGVFPLVLGIKALALATGLAAVSTTERLEGLVANGTLGQAFAGQVRTAFACVQSLRLRGQVAALGQGRSPDNLVCPGCLAPRDREALRAAFRTVEQLREILTHRFGLHLLT